MSQLHNVITYTNEEKLAAMKLREFYKTHGFHQRSLAGDKHGKGIPWCVWEQGKNVRNPEACAFCLMGASLVLELNDDVVESLLRKSINNPQAVTPVWNDLSYRQKRDVEEMLDRVIEGVTAD